MISTRGEIIGVDGFTLGFFCPKVWRCSRMYASWNLRARARASALRFSFRITQCSNSVPGGLSVQGAGLPWEEKFQ